MTKHLVISLPIILYIDHIYGSGQCLKVYAGEHQRASRKGSQLVLTLARAPLASVLFSLLKEIQ